MLNEMSEKYLLQLENLDRLIMEKSSAKINVKIDEQIQEILKQIALLEKKLDSITWHIKKRC